MRARRRWTRIAATLVMAVAIAACAGGGPEAELRADLEATGLSNESIDCLVEAFGIASLTELENLTPSTDVASSECVGQVLAELFAGAFDEAFDDLASGDWEVTGDGDAPSRDDMEALAEQCRNGDNEACDDLWLVSPIDSPEEQLAESCGGRSTEPRMGSCSFWLDD